MRNRSKLVLAGLTASAVMAAAVGSATAQRFGLSESRFTVAWTALRFTETSGRESISITCSVTLEGSLHSSTISKVAGALIGFVNRATSPGCSGGRITVLQETLPWHVRYRSFVGSLPNVTSVGISLVGLSYQIREAGGFLTCLARSEASRPADYELPRNVRVGGAISGATANEEPAIPASGGLCLVTSVRQGGTGTITRQGSTALITVRLI